MHTKVQEAFIKAGTSLELEVKIPQIFCFANDKTVQFWNENLDNFPFTDTFPRRPRDALCMKRVLPLPQPLRHHLIDKYCTRNQESAKAYKPNQDCLVRPLLGRKRHGSGNVAFSLRNFRLHLDQFEELGLDVAEYATAMADAMAVLHCVARIDAMDIEFVIGTAPTDMHSCGKPLRSNEIAMMSPRQSTFELAMAKDFKHRILSLWMLDFDACSTIDLDQAGAEAAIRAFMGTEAYCPRPHPEKPKLHKLWRLFGLFYYHTCVKLGAGSKFPNCVLHGIEKAVQAARNSSTRPSSEDSRVSVDSQSRGRGSSSRGHGYGQLGRRGSRSGE